MNRVKLKKTVVIKLEDGREKTLVAGVTYYNLTKAMKAQIPASAKAAERKKKSGG